MSEMEIPGDDGLAEGIAQGSGQAVRAGVTAAALAREQLARIQRDQAERQQHELEQRALQHESAAGGYVAAVRADLEKVQDPAWWDQAEQNPALVGPAWQMADEFRHEDARIAELAEHMESEASRRWGVSLSEAGAAGAADATLTREQAAHQSAQREDARADVATGATLAGADVRREQHAEAAEATGYDSDERRSQLGPRAMNAGADPGTTTGCDTAQQPAPPQPPPRPWADARAYPAAPTRTLGNHLTSIAGIADAGPARERSRGVRVGFPCWRGPGAPSHPGAGGPGPATRLGPLGEEGSGRRGASGDRPTKAARPGLGRGGPAHGGHGVLRRLVSVRGGLQARSLPHVRAVGDRRGHEHSCAAGRRQVPRGRREGP